MHLSDRPLPLRSGSIRGREETFSTDMLINGVAQRDLHRRLVR